MSNFITPTELLACLDEVIILDGIKIIKKAILRGLMR